MKGYQNIDDYFRPSFRDSPSPLPEFNAVLISSVRFAMYGLISLAVALPIASRLFSQLTRTDLMMLLRLSLTGNVLNYALLGASVQLSGVTAASLINGIMPVANGPWNACSRRMAASLSGQMIVFETLFACVYGFLYAQRLPSVLELVSISLLVGGVVWAARRHRVPNVKLESPAC
jgi:drug/metabolite transporter (DMT)-like permease